MLFLGACNQDVIADQTRDRSSMSRVMKREVIFFTLIVN